MSDPKWTKRAPKREGFYLARKRYCGELCMVVVTWKEYAVEGPSYQATCYAGEKGFVSYQCPQSVPMRRDFVEWKFMHGFKEEEDSNGK